MDTYINEIQKKLGFGCLRLPMKDGAVDTKEFCNMVDAFLENGFNYFDTARVYLNGESETALRECLTSRYPRDRYILANKLTRSRFKRHADIRPLFESQLAACGVEYFDYYLMHAQTADTFNYFKRHRAYETALELKREGKLRHFGISFHDKANVLEQILIEYPQIEVVQIQFNYVDYEDSAVESRKCYEVCRKFGKPVIIMEPVKGGTLANLPEDAKAVLDELHGGSPASYALRFAAGFDGIAVVLSGMSNMEQMKDNISFMKDFQPLSQTEMAAIDKVTEIFNSKKLIPCTACRYCTAGCPKHILIPDLFACMNAKKNFDNRRINFYYDNTYTTQHNGKASDCIKCGKCEQECPQHLPIRELLVDVANEFEKTGGTEMKKGSIISTVVGAAAGAAAGAFAMARSKEEILTQKKQMSDKHFDLFMLMNQWLITKQQKKEITTYFHDNNYKKIAIYGMSYVGERLYDELQPSDIEVCYAIDNRANKIYVDLDVYTMEDDLPKVDVIVVTAISYFDEISEKLAEITDIPVVSLEDIIYEL